MAQPKRSRVPKVILHPETRAMLRNASSQATGRVAPDDDPAVTDPDIKLMLVELYAMRQEMDQLRRAIADAMQQACGGALDGPDLCPGAEDIRDLIPDCELIGEQDSQICLGALAEKVF